MKTLDITILIYHAALCVSLTQALTYNIDNTNPPEHTLIQYRVYAAFDDFGPVSNGGVGAETHDLAGHEDNPAFTEHS